MAKSLILMAILCAACASPTTVATASPTATSAAPVSTPSPTPTPTASARQTPAIAHPTGATDVVLRMWRSGGFLYPGTTLDEAPIFTLYGDGRVIYTVEEPGDGSPVRRLAQAQLTDEQVGAVIENALGPGGLAPARDRYADVPMADGTTTNFEINAGGMRKTVAVYALGEYEDPGASDAGERAAFEALAAELRSFGTEVSAGNVIDLGPFEPASYRVSIFPDVSNELVASANWPWPEPSPSDFVRDNSGFGRLVTTAEQGALVAQLPIGEMGDPVVLGPDGVTYLIRARPLLPDELP